ncbi:hypothetical protein CLOM_g15847 [Closterium sp. NIES-68]|nr:hypothetical protein CLOM_g15847 [Closterium sp. NIES-68]
MPALPPTLAAAAPVAWGGGSLVEGRAAFSADGQRLLCPCGAVVRVFALASATQVQVLRGHTALVTCVSTSAVARSPPAASAAAARDADDADDPMGDGPSAVVAADAATSSLVYAWSGSLDGTMRLWNFVTGAALRVLHLGRPIRDLVMYPYASTEVVEGAGGREEERQVPPVALVVVANERRGCDLLQYDVFGDTCLATPFHQMLISSPLAISPATGRLLAFSSGRCVFVSRCSRPSHHSRLLLQHRRAVTCVAIHPDDQQVRLSCRLQIPSLSSPSAHVPSPLAPRPSPLAPRPPHVPDIHCWPSCLSSRHSLTPSHTLSLASPPPSPPQVAAGDVLGRVVVWHGIGRRSGWAWGEERGGTTGGGRGGRGGGWRGMGGRGGERGGRGGGGGRWRGGRGRGRGAGGDEGRGEGESEAYSRVAGQEDCEAVSSLHWHASAVADLAFAPDGLHLVSIGAEAVALVWQVESGVRRFLPRMAAALLRLVLPPSLLPALPPPAPPTPGAEAPGAAAEATGCARSLVAPASAPEALRFGFQCADNCVRVVDLSESALIAAIHGIAPPPPARPLPARHFLLPPPDPFTTPLASSTAASSLSNCLPADVARQLAVELAVTGGGAPSAVVQAIRGGWARLLVIGPLGVLQVYDAHAQQAVGQVRLMRVNVVSQAEARFKKALKAQELQQRDKALHLLQGDAGKGQQHKQQQQGPKPPPIWVSHVCFSPDGRTMVTAEIRQPEDMAGQQSTLKFWAAPFGGTHGSRQGSSRGRKGGSAAVTALTTAVDAPHGSVGLITGVDVHPGGDLVATCGTDGEFRTWTRVWGEGEGDDDDEDEEGGRGGGKPGRGGMRGQGGRGRGGGGGKGGKGESRAKTARERMEEREAAIAPLTFCWRCRAVGSFAHQPLLAARFSWDGAVLAVAAMDRVALWHPQHNSLLATLQCTPSLRPLQAALPWKQPVTALGFVAQTPFLVAVSGALAPSGTFFAPSASPSSVYSALSVWSLLSLSLMWTLHLRTLSLATHPSAPRFAVIVAGTPGAAAAGGGGGREAGKSSGEAGEGMEDSDAEGGGEEEGDEEEDEEEGAEEGEQQDGGGDRGGDGVKRREWVRRIASEGVAVPGAVLVFEGGESPVPVAAWEMNDVTGATVAFMPPASSPAASSRGGAMQWSIVVVSGGREYAVLNGEESTAAPDAADLDGVRLNGAAGLADAEAISAFESIYGAATTAAAAAAGAMSEQPGSAAGDEREEGVMEAVGGRPWGNLLSAPSHVLPSLERVYPRFMQAMLDQLSLH